MVPIRKSLALSVSSAYSILIVNTISVMIVSRILTPEEIGIYSVCAAIVGTAAIIRNSGIGEYLIQERELNPDHIHTPGIFVQRIFKGASFEKMIEQRTTRPRE